MGNKRGPSRGLGRTSLCYWGLGLAGRWWWVGRTGVGVLSDYEEESFGDFVGYAVAAEDADEGEGEFH